MKVAIMKTKEQMDENELLKIESNENNITKTINGQIYYKV